ncbi:MAG: Holliday junction resolvase RuvX [Steroidobacteraceae bacterium]
MPERAAPAAPPTAGGAAAEGAAPRLILAFDYGQRRIGVACGDTVSRTAAPLGGVAASGAGAHWAVIDALMREWKPAVLVVGLPYNVDGSESAVAVAARGFAGELGRRYALSVQLVDERYSSLEAETRLKAARESGLRRRRVAKADIDAAAACIVLERWFTEKT